MNDKYDNSKTDREMADRFTTRTDEICLEIDQDSDDWDYSNHEYDAPDYEPRDLAEERYLEQLGKEE